MGYNLRREKTFSERERGSMRHVRESERGMTWTFVGAGIMTWRCLNEEKKFVSDSSLIYISRILIQCICMGELQKMRY